MLKKTIKEENKFYKRLAEKYPEKYLNDPKIPQYTVKESLLFGNGILGNISLGVFYILIINNFFEYFQGKQDVSSLIINSIIFFVIFLTITLFLGVDKWTRDVEKFLERKEKEETKKSEDEKKKKNKERAKAKEEFSKKQQEKGLVEFID